MKRTHPILKWTGLAAVGRAIVKAAVRGYAGAAISRLTTSLTSANASANAEIWNSLETLRARSRQLERDNRYMRKFLASLEANIIGENGFTLQMRVTESDGKTPDRLANDAVETAWWEWGQTCTIEEENWHQTMCLILRRVAVDGEILIRKHIVTGRKHPAAIELIEADRLDFCFNQTLDNGNQIIMGVEIDSRGRRVAYHVLNYMPTDVFFRAPRLRRRERIAASEIIHVFVKERPGQLRGVPWTAAVMDALHNLQGYEQAEVLAARVSANKLGFFRSDDGTGYKGELNADGSQEMNAEETSFENIGTSHLETFDPTHPNGNYPGFAKQQLRGIASGLIENYETLSGDYEGVTYTSLRAAALVTREGYVMRQEWLVAAFISPVFDWWLEIDLMAGAITMPNGSALPLRKLDKFNAPGFEGRRWAWVDPTKEVAAYTEAINQGFKSRRQIIAENGGDLEEIVQDIAIENSILASANMVPSSGSARFASEIAPGEAETLLVEKIGVGGTGALIQTLTSIGQGMISEEAGVQILSSVFGIGEEEARKMCQPPKKKPEAPPKEPPLEAGSD